MNKRIILLTFILVLTIGIVNSQVSIKGRILSSKSGKGIEYATIHKEGTNVGVICDSVGYFELNNLKSIPDSLIISCVGYNPKNIYKEILTITENLEIKVDEKEFLLDELEVVRNKVKKKTMTFGKPWRNYFSYSPLYYASQRMRYFEVNSFPSYINEFRFYACRVKGDKAARIRIYSIDSLTQKPDYDLLNSNLIIKNIKNGWNKVDLHKYEILILKGGFYIGLESVVIDKDCYGKVGENRWVSKNSDFDIACVNENTLTAKKSQRIGAYEVFGEMKVSDNNEWLISQGRGFDLLYRVKIGYYE